MKKKVFCAVLVSMLLLSTMLCIGTHKVEAESTTVVYVDPEISYATAGQTFSISVNVDNVTELYGYEFRLYWNNTLLECIEVADTPPAVWKACLTLGLGLQQNHNSTHGRYWRGVAAFTPVFPSFNGSTTLAILTFQVKDDGESVLNLRDTILVNKKAEEMAHSAEDGYFEFRPLQHDVAAFVDAPGHVTPGDTVMLNVTVLNVGLNNETDLELQLLLNGSIANSTIISFLQVGSSYTLSHLWTTSTVEAIHNVTAYAMPVHDENFTLNNMESAIVAVSYVIRVPFHYPKIQQAIEVANPGDTILVSAGTYYEHLTVDKSLTLVSEGSGTPIIDGNGTDVVIRVRADNVMIDRFVIRDGIYGIKVEWHDFTMVIGNTILNNEAGISFGDSDNNIVIGNTLLDNSVSIDLVDSYYNTIYHNNFINNTKQIPYMHMDMSTWDNGCEGNYWSDYAGEDLNGDGIGDTLLPHQGVDNYPLMNPYMEGDANHDAIVDIVDGVIMGVAFGTEPSDPKWNPHADLNEDGIINIIDIVIWATHFGESW